MKQLISDRFWNRGFYSELFLKIIKPLLLAGTAVHLPLSNSFVERFGNFSFDHDRNQICFCSGQHKKIVLRFCAVSRQRDFMLRNREQAAHGSEFWKR